MLSENTISNISTQVGELWNNLENTLSLKINIELAKNVVSDIDVWKNKSLLLISKLTDYANKIVSKQRKIIDNATEKAIVLAYKQSNSTLGNYNNDDELTRLQEEKVVDVVLPRELESTFNYFKQFNDNNYKRLINATPSKVGQMINRIIINYNISIRGQFANRKISKDILYKSIYNQTEIGIDNGYKVTYANGRNINFKSYMEMNVRTTLQAETNMFIQVGSKALGVELFLASSHNDCADDHAKWQGKIYLADDAIDRYNGKYKRIGEATSKGFTTRPNCRHYFTPITNEQATQGVKSLSNELKTSQGKYNSEHYKMLKKQRINERQIRKYKTRLQNDEQMVNNSSNNEERLFAQQNLNKNKKLISKWQKRNKVLTDKNSYLKRDYRRESQKVIVQDLGIKYQISYEAKQ